MQARDIMTTNVVTVRPDTGVREIAALLRERGISGAPVVDADGQVVGFVSEGDLVRRPENRTERHPSWWLALVAQPEERALAYIKSHGGQARDVMTGKVVSVSEETSLEEIADLLERHRIKRVPVLRDGRVVGIVSRADLLHGLIARQATPKPAADDRTIKESVEAALPEAGVRAALVSVVVSDGVVRMWGAVETEAERRAARLAAEGVPGVRQVIDHVGILPQSVRSVLWAE